MLNAKFLQFFIVKVEGFECECLMLETLIDAI